jgi:hypothetical protein
MASGKVAAPALAMALIEALAPTLTVATGSRGVMNVSASDDPPVPSRRFDPGQPLL